MTDIAIIGGSGLTELKGLEVIRREVVYTPYGEPSGPITRGIVCEREAIFLARHGKGYNIPPHKVNYRANILALKTVGVKKIIAVNAVGGIRQDMKPGQLAFPDQIVDYTYSRKHTFSGERLERVFHVDFTHPYSDAMRAKMIAAARRARLKVVENGTYAAMQGPRLETAAEINRLERDGCDMVGMTGMPEAVLARELELEYACCAVVANWAAGRGPGSLHTQIDRYLPAGMGLVKRLMAELLPTL